jgi:phage anti-repressor protein
MKSLSKEDIKEFEEIMGTCSSEEEFFELLREMMRSAREQFAQPRSLYETLVGLKKVMEVSDAILGEIGKRFDVDVSEMVASSLTEGLSGGKPFLEWYNEMATLKNKNSLESLICSSCPYCTDKSGATDCIPCELLGDDLLELPNGRDCLLTSATTNLMSREDFLAMMEEQKGKEARIAYMAREKELRRPQAKEIVQVNQERAADGRLPTIPEMEKAAKFFVDYDFGEELAAYFADVLRAYPRALDSVNIILVSLEQTPLTR